MKIYNIPCVYKMTGGNRQAKWSIMCSDALTEKLKTLCVNPGWNTVQAWSGITEYDPTYKINTWAEDAMLNRSIEFYRCALSTDPDPTSYSASYKKLSTALSKFNIYPTLITPPTDSAAVNSTETLGGIDLNQSGTAGNIADVNFYNCYFKNAYLDQLAYVRMGTIQTIQVNYVIFPEDFFDGDTVNSKYLGDTNYYAVSVIITAHFNIDYTAVDSITIEANKSNYTVNYLADKFKDFTLKNSQTDIDDVSNPYGIDGVSGPGGGNGTLRPGGLDSIDPAEIPDLPTISAADLGFITMYNPTAAQLKNLSDYMWSNAFDLITYKKLFSDPMESIIGLSIVPVAPSIGGSKNVMFGTIDSGISMSYLSTNYVQLDCGSVAIEKYIGCFMDNDPYTKISIYLPFIGIRQISADDVIGGSIHVVYNVDVLTGACACFIEHSERGVLYSYNGNCITNVPLTAINFTGAIQNAVTAVGSMLGIAAGMATGAAPVTAMSAASLATSAANTALNSKPQVQRSGNLGGSAGIMSIMTPYVIIERPSLSVPDSIQRHVGQTSNITMQLGTCSGFTMCDYVHLDNISATTEEITEIESMLKAGVIL